jgi:hypothetical protein
MSGRNTEQSKARPFENHEGSATRKFNVKSFATWPRNAFASKPSAKGWATRDPGKSGGLRWWLLELQRGERFIARKLRDRKPYFVAALVRMTAKGEDDEGQRRGNCCHAALKLRIPRRRGKRRGKKADSNGQELRGTL